MYILLRSKLALPWNLRKHLIWLGFSSARSIGDRLRFLEENPWIVETCYLVFSESRIRCCAAKPAMAKLGFLAGQDTHSGLEIRVPVLLPALGTAVQAGDVAPLGLTQ